MKSRERSAGRRPKRQTRQGRPQLTGAQRVYAALRDAIIVLDLEPGSALEEERLCRQYSVSRTPTREALIRLASEGLVELEPNRGAKVAALQFIDVVDHYEAMDILQPAIWHFAAVRATEPDLMRIRECLETLRAALAREDARAIVQCNYNVHSAIAACCHNRSLEKASRQMLVDKLRVAQHAIRGILRDRGHVLAKRLAGALRVLDDAVAAIARGDANTAQRLARDYNGHVRKQIIDILSTSLGVDVKLSPAPRKFAVAHSVSPRARSTSLRAPRPH